MKVQRKRLVPGLPHRPVTVRWSPFLGWHRLNPDRCAERTYCTTQQRGERVALGPLP